MNPESDQRNVPPGVNSQAASLCALLEADRHSLWHAFTPMATYEPFVIERAEGMELIDVHGNRYLDAESSLWCSVHGHRNEHIDRAIRKQLDRVAHVTLLGMACDTTVKLAQELVARSPAPLGHVFFSSDGACAVEVALKLAFEYWKRVSAEQQRHKFLCFDAAYHGDTLGTQAVGGIDRFNQVFSPLFYEVVRAPSPHGYHLPDNIEPAQACEEYLRIARRYFEQHASQLAAVVIEPLIQCAAGIVKQPPGFLKGIETLCREFDVLLIADEIAVGCGRTGKWLACEHESVVPDLLCLGKGLSAGYLPLSATIASTPIWESFLGTSDAPSLFCHGHTFGGNPLACAAALASLELIDRHHILDNVIARSQQLLAEIDSLKQHRHVGDVRGEGLALGVELVEDRATKRSFDASRRIGQKVCAHATKNGVWLRPLGDTIVLMPPLAIGASDTSRIAKALREAIEQVLS